MEQRTGGEDLSYLEGLNDAQRAAVEYDAGPSIVIAGAGSGKTRVLVSKLIHLIRTGYPARGLMALTFTNKAAREMKERVGTVMGARVAREIRMGTFHSIFLRLLRTPDVASLGYAPNFSLYKPSDAKALIKRIVKDMGLNDSLYKDGLIYNRISLCKNKLISPAMYAESYDYRSFDRSQKVPELWRIYQRYQRTMQELNAMDFDDLLFNTHRLLRDFPEVRRHYQETIDYLLVDEYQDTNVAQFEILRLLVNAEGKIFVVGDDAQSIYAFRGANINNILRFGETFRGARLFKLEQNYRSSQRIVQAANAIIKKNRNQIPKEVFSQEEEGELIKVFSAEDAEEEADWIAQQIDHVMAQERAELSDFAILYRTNAQSRILEDALRRSGLPYVIYGGLAFYDRKEIMDVMAYLRLIVNDKDEGALLRIINYPKRGIGSTTIDKLVSSARGQGVPLYDVLSDPESYGVALSKGTLSKVAGFIDLIEGMKQTARAIQPHTFAEAMKRLIYSTGIPADLRVEQTEEARDRAGNVEELLSGVIDFAEGKEAEGEEASLESYLAEVMLLTDQDQARSGDDQKRIQLMTIHASKGLEFPNVFVCGLEEGLFPSERSMEAHEVEEERRLFYVALTRAERRCYISYASERMLYGRTGYQRPSRFVMELPRELIREGDRLERRNQRPSWGSPKSGRRLGDELPSSFPTSRSFLGEGRAFARPEGQEEGGRMPAPSARDSADMEGRAPASVDELGEGLRVWHAKFGQGTIVSVEELKKGEPIAVVEFDEAGQKKLGLRFARLVLVD